MKTEPNDIIKSETANPVFDKDILKESLKFLPLGSLGSLGQSFSAGKRNISKIAFGDIFDTDKGNGN